MESIKKIVVIGPESTGKSLLCEKLAAHYHTSWVPEYAREYLGKHGPDYTYTDLKDIAAGQIELEEEALKKLEDKNPHHSPFTTHHSPLFIDTDMYVIKVWSEFVFNKCNNWILNRIAERKYDLYLLCDVDLPWVKDDLREYPDLKVRKKLFYFYKDLLVNQQVPWCQISGDYDQRFSKATNFIENSFT
jgi:NadR type nicotinamide-nucleotide adenylyltransferase